MPNRQDLPSELTKARQQLQKAQKQVAELEAQLFEGLPNIVGPTGNDDRYHRTLDTMLEGCQIIGFDWRYLYVNDAAAHHGQRTKDELLGHTMMELYPGIETTSMFAVLQRCMQERHVERIENEFIYPNGVSSWFELSVQPVPEGIFILSLDVSDRKKTEEALRLSEEMFSSVFHVSPAGLIITRISDGKSINANQAFCEMFEFSRNDVIGHTLTELNVWTWEEHQRLMQQQREMKGLHNVELTVRSKSGRHINVLFSSKALQLQGEVCQLSTIIDITERKLIEEAVQRREMHLREINERKAQERQLRYHASIQESVSDAVIATDMELRIQSWNKAAVRIYGWTAEEALGKVASELLQIRFPPNHDSDADLKQFNEHGFMQQETIQRHKNGTDLSIFGSATRFEDENGVPLGIIAVNRDISERKAQERQLRYHASIQESVSDAVIATDMDFRIQSWNPAAEKIYGWKAAQAIGKPVNDVLQTSYESEADRERIFHDFLERGAWQGEVIQRHRDGSLINVLASTNLFKDDMGNPFGVVTVNRDITERKQIIKSLQQSSAEIHDLYNNAPCGYHSIDKDGVIVQINDTELQWLGYSRAEVVGKLKITAFFTPESLVAFQRTFPIFLERGWINDLEMDMVRKDGSIMHTLVNATTVYDENGNYLKSRSILFDITERKQINEILRQSEERFASVFRFSPVAIGITTAAEGRYLDVNDSLLALLGYSRDEMIGRTSSELNVWITPEEREVVLQTIQEKGSVHELEVRFRQKNGGICTTLMSGVPVMLNGQACLFFMVQDITERKAAEEALNAKAAEERKFQSYLKALHEIVIELSAIDELDAFYRRAVTLGLERLGFERLAMFLYDDQSGDAVGTFGTDAHGNLSDERGFRFKPDPNGIMKRSFEGAERFYFKEQITLYTHEIPSGNGWNAAAVLWNGTQSLGWFVADNLLSHTPASKSLLDILGIYALSAGTLLAQKQTQRALREREALYRLLAENISDMVMRSTMTGECLYISPSVQAILGYRDEEFISQRTFELVHPDDHTIISDAYNFGLGPSDLIMPHQYRAKHKDGHYIWLETVGKPLFRDGESQMSEVITSSRDITERKQAEKAIRESEARYRLLAENLADIIMTFSLDRIIIYMSPSCERILGYLPEEVEGKSHGEFIHPEDYPQVIDKTRRAVVSKEHAYTNQFRLRHKVGFYIWFEVRTRIVVEPDTGNVIQFVSMLRDITERKVAEESLRESEEKYRSLVETMRGGLAVFDPEFRVIYVNDRFGELLGYSREEIIGKESISFVDDIHLPLVQSHLERRQNAESTSYEVPLRHKDGRQIYTLVSGAPLLNKQGKYSGSFVVATDISIQKQAEEVLREALVKEKELGDLKTRFVSMASHEFRTPLSTILALTETLSAYRHKLPEEQIQERLNKIKDQIGHLKDIMEDVLMLARMQARRIEFNPVKVDLQSLLRSVIDEFLSPADFKHRLEYTVTNGSREVMVDRKLMRQIISNLVSNAIKYSPESKVARINLEYTDSFVILKVSDEGIGIPEADLPHLFEPFHRAANVGAISGTGLGLVITHEAVELHGGTITVESQQGVGTTFVVRIPISAEG